MTDSAPRHRRVPHWGWLLTGTMLLAVLFVAIRFGLPLYRLQRTLAVLREKNCQIESRDPPWLLTWIGQENLATIFSRSISINASYSEVTDADLRHLAGLKNLESLSLDATGITDTGLAHLSRLKHLDHLGLRCTEITDLGLAHLAGLTELRKLDLTETVIRGDGLIYLAGLKNLEAIWLERLWIRDCSL